MEKRTLIIAVPVTGSSGRPFTLQAWRPDDTPEGVRYLELTLDDGGEVRKITGSHGRYVIEETQEIITTTHPDAP